MNKILLGCIPAMLAFAACSNDEPIVGNQGNNDITTTTGETAYLNIRIQDVNNARSRANNEYEAGTAEETKVNSAKFLFFMADGAFFTEVNKWQDGEIKNPGTDVNIEHLGEGTLVLRGLKASGYPKYMITVLNSPDFEPENTLEATAKKLSDIRYKASDGKVTDFIMSTTSYYGTAANHVDEAYYATTLNVEDFQPEIATEVEKIKYIDVYVERLAAKVTFGPTDELAETLVEVNPENGTPFKGYKLNVTISGTANEEGGNEGIVEGNNELYVVINGWGLNQTTKNSYLSKQLGDWATTGPWTGWQKPDDFRSFWGQSTVYGQEVGANNLNIITYQGAGTELGSPLYTPEHTNTIENITIDGKDADGQTVKVINNTKPTSVILTAKVVDKNGNPVDLVEFSGAYFTHEGYKAYVLAALDAAKKLNFWYVSGTEEVDQLDTNGDVVKGENGETQKVTVNKYAQVDKSYISIESKPDGRTGEIYVVANVPANTTLYSYNSTDKKYTEIENGAEMFAETISDYQKNLTKATGFKDGAMYYNIPVKHLNPAALEEGSYGVVRNHIYKITFSSLKKLGHGVYKPGTGSEEPEPIVPDEPEDDTYYLGTTVKILSWKIVTQEVEL